MAASLEVRPPAPVSLGVPRSAWPPHDFALAIFGANAAAAAAEPPPPAACSLALTRSAAAYKHTFDN